MKDFSTWLRKMRLTRAGANRLGDERASHAMRTLLLPTYWDHSFQDRIDAAVALTQHLDAHLICAMSKVGSAQANRMRHVFTEDELAIIADLKGYVEACLDAHDVARSWVSRDTLNPATIAQVARLADLILLPARWSISVPESPRPSDFMIRTAIPTLVVPPSAPMLSTRPRILAAWDGSAASAAALRASVPLLRHATSTTLLTIGDAPPNSPIDPVAYLRWHSISATTRIAPRTKSICNTILDHLGEGPCDLLVMGAYGRSRWVQEMFGGVTTSMLEHSPVPILMARSSD